MKNLTVKICGLRRREDIELALQLGATALGFILYEKSPRYAEPDLVAALLKDLPAHRASTVGVFVNATAEQIDRVVQKTGIRTIQLHGDETPSFVSELSLRFPNLEIVKALRLQSTKDLGVADSYKGTKTFLLDTFIKGEFGGTGAPNDFALAAEFRKRFADKKTVLSGGLRPENILEAIDRVAPSGVDISSGIEASPGKKDPAKMKSFFEKIRNLL